MRLNPCVLAIERTLQSVVPTGVVCCVASTTALTFSALNARLRPGLGRSRIRPGRPNCLKRPRHSKTVRREVWSCRAIAWLGSPWLASNTTRARKRILCEDLPERTNCSSRFCWLASIPGWWVETKGNYPVKAMKAKYLGAYLTSQERRFMPEQVRQIMRRRDE